MALLTAIVPNFSAIPIISTTIFVICLATGALLLSSLYARTNSEAIAFSGILIASPIWLHIGEFNTLSWGVGIGLLATCVAIRFVLTPRPLAVLLAGLLAAFALSVYQSLIVVYAIVCVTALVGSNPFWQIPILESETIGRSRLLLNIIASMLFAAIAYVAIQFMAVKIAHVQMGYVENFIQPRAFLNDFFGTTKRVISRIQGLLVGSDPTFLGWGRAVLFPAWLGVAAGLAGLVTSRRYSWPLRATSILAFIAIIVGAAGLIIASAGQIPTRALVGFPLIYALLGLSGFRAISRPRWISWSVLAYSIFICAWTSTSLFYLDQLVRQRDQVTAEHLIYEIKSVAGTNQDAAIPITVVGELHYEDTFEGHPSNIEIFGTSFFQQDGGNIYRIASYLRLLGLSHLQPVPIENVRDRLPAIDQMPKWPTPGSVANLNGIIVIKLGPLSYQQQLALEK